MVPSEVVGDKGKKYKVTTIGELAFARCKSLLSIEFPESLTSMGDFAFGDCSLR